MYSDPCAKFTTRVTPKMSESPEAMRNSTIALARPESSWTTTIEGVRAAAALAAGAHLLHLVRGRKHLVAGYVLVVHHHADAALGVDLRGADPRAQCRLPVGRAVGDRPDRRLHLEV